MARHVEMRDGVQVIDTSAGYIEDDFEWGIEQGRDGLVSLWARKLIPCHDMDTADTLYCRLGPDFSGIVDPMHTKLSDIRKKIVLLMTRDEAKEHELADLALDLSDGKLTEGQEADAMAQLMSEGRWH